MTKSRSFLLGMRNVSHKVCREFETHILCSINLLASRAVYENMWENIVDPDSSQRAI
jgi:hypothetical protein